MSLGFLCTPLTRNSKCRCGPVAHPVEPSGAHLLPLRHALAGPHVDAAQVGIQGLVVLLCLTMTTLPKPFCSPANSTKPSPTVRTGVPVTAP